MASVADVPRQMIERGRDLALAPVRPFLPAGSVDEWGRDVFVGRKR
jgi:hypothetical protein